MEGNKKNKVGMIVFIFMLLLLPAIIIYIPGTAKASVTEAFTPPNNQYRDIAEEFGYNATYVAGYTTTVTNQQKYFEVGNYYYFTNYIVGQDYAITIAGETLPVLDNPYNNTKIGCFHININGLYWVNTSALTNANFYVYFNETPHNLTQERPVLPKMFRAYSHAYWNRSADGYFMQEIFFFKFTNIWELYLTQTQMNTEFAANWLVAYTPQTYGAGTCTNISAYVDGRYPHGAIIAFIAGPSSVYVLNNVQIWRKYPNPNSYAVQTNNTTTPAYVGNVGAGLPVYKYTIGYTVNNDNTTYYNNDRWYNYTINNTGASDVYSVKAYEPLYGDMNSTHYHLFYPANTTQGIGPTAYHTLYWCAELPEGFAWEPESNELGLLKIINIGENARGICSNVFGVHYYVQGAEKIHRMIYDTDIEQNWVYTGSTNVRDHNIVCTQGGQGSVYIGMEGDIKVWGIDLQDAESSRYDLTGTATVNVPYVHFTRFYQSIEDTAFIYSEIEHKLYRVKLTLFSSTSWTYEIVYSGWGPFSVATGYTQVWTSAPIWEVDWTSTDSHIPEHIYDMTSNTNQIFLSGKYPADKRNITYYNKMDGSFGGTIPLNDWADNYDVPICCWNNETLFVGNASGLWALNTNNFSVLYSNTSAGFNDVRHIISDYIVDGFTYIVTHSALGKYYIHKVWSSNLTHYGTYNYTFSNEITDICLDPAYNFNYLYATSGQYVYKFQNYKWNVTLGAVSPEITDLLVAVNQPTAGGTSWNVMVSLGDIMGISQDMAGFMLAGCVICLLLVVGLMFGVRSGLVFMSLGLVGCLICYALGFIPIWVFLMFGVLGAGMLVWSGFRG